MTNASGSSSGGNMTMVKNDRERKRVSCVNQVSGQAKSGANGEKQQNGGACF